MVKITPDLLTMESETVLTQYIIMNWTLAYKNISNIHQYITEGRRDNAMLSAGDPSQGIRMTIILQRRIINAILTIYLPTLLILCIVYATNFFKDFFFEAVVTVNLTGEYFQNISKIFPNICQRCWC